MGGQNKPRVASSQVKDNISYRSSKVREIRDAVSPDSRDS